MDKKTAFTLIELMVAMGVVAVITALSIFGVQQVLKAQTNTQKRKVLDQLDLELSSYLNNNGSVPRATGAVTFTDSEIQINGAGVGIDIAGDKAEYCYEAVSNQLYVTSVVLEGGKVECRGTANADTCTTGGTTYTCGGSI